jgi:hypothetical protein
MKYQYIEFLREVLNVALKHKKAMEQFICDLFHKARSHINEISIY